jgi:hypothetical protein
MQRGKPCGRQRGHVPRLPNGGEDLPAFGMQAQRGIAADAGRATGDQDAAAGQGWT